MEFSEKFVAFVDVLGFKGMVEASEAGQGKSLSEILEYLAVLGTPEDEQKLRRKGAFCPESQCKRTDLDFKITQISDCVIVSSELSPKGLINLVGHCWAAVTELLTKGIMCRGYITKGNVHHEESQVIGTAYQQAFANESRVSAFKIDADEYGTPFVEVDPGVCEFVTASKDRCVQEMFSRMTKTEEGTTALFPFQAFSHSFAIGGIGSEFDADKELKSNENMRKQIILLKDRLSAHVDPSNDRAVKKLRHYIKALDSQVTVCDQTEDMIRDLCRPLPSRSN